MLVSKFSCQVFYNAPFCYALVNIKPLLPGHVLVVSNRIVPRFTDLSTDEVTDLFTTVKKVQKMLARVYFTDRGTKVNRLGTVEDGAFNIALQDGKTAGQTVEHVHCHIIPRTKDSTGRDEIYDRMESEEGNVGGGLWDRSRPVQMGKFPKIEDESRKPRSDEEMNKEAAFFREQMALVD
jgi:bis(5'-adenosyl)-triphosphatase